MSNLKEAASKTFVRMCENGGIIQIPRCVPNLDWLNDCQSIENMDRVIADYFITDMRTAVHHVVMSLPNQVMFREMFVDQLVMKRICITSFDVRTLSLTPDLIITSAHEFDMFADKLYLEYTSPSYGRTVELKNNKEVVPQLITTLQSVCKRCENLKQTVGDHDETH